MKIYFIYAIRSIKFGRMYVGMTIDLGRRLK
jgi:predicted GIY-YIG superfamily endonuclease